MSNADHKEPGAEAKFKDISNAYEVLSDDQKRGIYDRCVHDVVRVRGYSLACQRRCKTDAAAACFEQGFAYEGSHVLTLDSVASLRIRHVSQQLAAASSCLSMAVSLSS